MSSCQFFHHGTLIILLYKNFYRVHDLICYIWPRSLKVCIFVRIYLCFRVTSVAEYCFGIHKLPICLFVYSIFVKLWVCCMIQYFVSCKRSTLIEVMCVLTVSTFCVCSQVDWASRQVERHANRRHAPQQRPIARMCHTDGRLYHDDNATVNM